MRLEDNGGQESAGEVSLGVSTERARERTAAALSRCSNAIVEQETCDERPRLRRENREEGKDAAARGRSRTRRYVVYAPNEFKS
jgi:hypothetical protein